MFDLSLLYDLNLYSSDFFILCLFLLAIVSMTTSIIVLLSGKGCGFSGKIKKFSLYTIILELLGLYYFVYGFKIVFVRVMGFAGGLAHILPLYEAILPVASFLSVLVGLVYFLLLIVSLDKHSLVKIQCGMFRTLVISFIFGIVIWLLMIFSFHKLYVDHGDYRPYLTIGRNIFTGECKTFHSVKEMPFWYAYDEFCGLGRR